MKLKKYILSVLSFCFLALASGFSIWNVNPDEEKSFPLNGTKGEVVAYFTDSKGNRREFTSIEGALKTAGEGTEANAANTIYVIPGKDPTIYGSCIIAENDTLCLPYENETYNGRQKNSESGGTSDGSWKQAASFDGNKPISGDYIPSQNETKKTPFADSNDAYVSYFRKNNVTLSANCTLTVSKNAFLLIGGILGWNGQGVTGQTSGKYCQITRNSNSQIVNHGTIDCRGYIKKSGNGISTKITSSRLKDKDPNPVIKAPLVFYDYQGGTYTACVYGGSTKIFPLAQYDFPNLQGKLVFDYPSKLIGYVDLFTDTTTAGNGAAELAARHNTDDLEVIGPKGEKNGSSVVPHLFETDASTTSVGSIVLERKTSNCEYTTLSGTLPDSVTNLNIFGECYFNATSISINAAADAKLLNSTVFGGLLNRITGSLNQTIITDSVYFPIPWNLQISVKSSGRFHIQNKVKLMQGALFTIENGGCLTLEANSKFIVYDKNLNSSLAVENSFSDSSSGKPTKPYPYPSSKGDAQVINEGTINILNSASIAGEITATSESAIINIDSNAILEINDCHEGTGNYEIAYASLKIDFYFYDFKNSPINKVGSVLSVCKYYSTELSGHSPNYQTNNLGEQKLISGSEYFSFSLPDGTYGWYEKQGLHDRYGILFDYHNDDGEEVAINGNPNSGVEYFENNGSDVTLNNLESLDTSLIFGGFYYDSNRTISVANNIIDPIKAICYLSNNILTIYTKWTKTGAFATIDFKSYHGGSQLLTRSTKEIDGAECGKAYDLTSFISKKDSKAGDVVSGKRKTEYPFQKWKLYDTKDSNTEIATDSFVPEEGHAYVIEPVYGEEKFLWRTVTNASWFLIKTYYVINDFSITNNSSRFTDGLFNAGSVLKNANEQNGWVKLGATIVVSIEDRIGLTEVNTVSISDGVETITYKGKNWSGGSATSSIDTNKWVSNFNAFGPIVITCWTKG